MLDAHGEFVVRVSGQVVYVRSIGSWNIECAKLYEQAFLEAVRTVKPNFPFFISIVDLRYWGLATADTLDYIGKIRTTPETYIMDQRGIIYLSNDLIQTDISEKKYIEQYTDKKNFYWPYNEPQQVEEKLKEAPWVDDIDELMSWMNAGDDIERHALSPK